MNSLPKILYMFDCPFHGLEHQLFCFRAFDKSLQENWLRYDIEYKASVMSESEIASITKQVAGKSDSYLGG